MSRNELASVRNEMLGFIFQQYNLLPRLNLMENVEVPLVYAASAAPSATPGPKQVLEQVGLGDKLRNRPTSFPAASRQRVSIARALVRNPAVILADEPTGALDSQTSRVVMDLFHELHEKYHKTIVLITHNPELAEECQRVLTLRDGLIVGERKGTGERAAF